MEKVLDILEKYVEWIGLALAAGFLGWMSWLYILNEPVSKPMGSQTVTVSDVDQTIYDTDATTVQNKMNAAKGQIPKFTVDNFSVAISKGLNLDGMQVAQLPDDFDFEPLKLPDTLNSSLPQEEQVTQLPELPAAEALLVEAGKTVIQKTPTTAPSGAATGPSDTDQGAASAAAGAAAAAGGTAAPGTSAPGTVRADMHWATVAFRIPMAPMADSWTKSFGPGKPGGAWKIAPVTEFLSITLYRSEKQADGTWSDETEVPRLWNNLLQSYPTQDRQQQLNYQQYATHQAADIVAPKFPDIAQEPAGTTWRDPLTLLPILLNPPPPAPAAPPPPPPAPPVRSGPGSPPAAPVAQVFPPESLEPTIASVDKTALPTTPPVLPSGSFNPAAAIASAAPGAAAAPVGQTDMMVYLHDDTVQPGHTYRYRIVYKLLNPLFDHAPQKAANQAWVDQFDLVSPKSAYSPEIAVPPTTYFYCAEGHPSPQQQGNRPAFTFEVFTWADGIWKKKSVDASPGDFIGSKDATADFATGFTYADGRRRNERFIVTLVDAEGATIVRDAERDMDSQDYKVKTQWAATPATPGAPGSTPAAGAGGTVSPPEE